MAPPTPPPSETTSSTSTPRPTPAPSPVPPPVPVETHPNRGALKPPNRVVTDPGRLAPEDAYKTFSPPRLRPLTEINGSAAASAAAAALRPAVASLRAPPAIPPVAAARLAEEKRRNASRKRRQPHEWKKLLWIKQHGYPDNYTDTKTFLDHLQRNPRLRPYDFWPLVADATVIVQHVCSVAIFICAYAGIYQDRLSPNTVFTCGTIATVAGWTLWEYWMGKEEREEIAALNKAKRISVDIMDDASTSSEGSSQAPVANGHVNGFVSGHANGHTHPKPSRGVNLSLSTSNLAAKNHEAKQSKHGQSLSRSSFQSISPIDGLIDGVHEPFPALKPTRSTASHSPAIPYSPTTLPQIISPRNQARLKTFKSALLIYFALLGLSPILKSLTKSTSSDSIWALATWLLIINVFFFDYGSHTPSSAPTSRSRSQSGTLLTLPVPIQPDTAGPGQISTRTPPFPSSLSTNAALMASTVLASRLPSSHSVFSLTLFSIQVFGLFPVFRRHLRHVSLPLHVLLTSGLIVLATSGLGLILSQSYTHTYGDCNYCLSWIWHVIFRSIVGMVVFGSSTVFIMGACSWWLIGLQRYKNVVIGPWDTAKPVLAGGYNRRGTGAD